jgi:hypothetical protein
MGTPFLVTEIADHLSRQRCWQDDRTKAVLPALAVQALGNQHESGHLMGDVPALVLVAAVLWYSSPSKE